VAPSSDSSKNVEAIKSSFDTELFITEIEQLPTFWTPDLLRTAVNKKKHLCFGDTGQEID